MNKFIIGINSLSGRLAAFYFPEATWILKDGEALFPPKEKWGPNILWDSPASRAFLMEFYRYLPPLEVWKVGAIYRGIIISEGKPFPKKGMEEYRQKTGFSGLSFGKREIVGWSMDKIEKDLHYFILEWLLPRQSGEKGDLSKEEEPIVFLCGGTLGGKGTFETRYFYKVSNPESILWKYPERYFYYLDKSLPEKRVTKLSYPFLGIETITPQEPYLLREFGGGPPQEVGFQKVDIPVRPKDTSSLEEKWALLDLLKKGKVFGLGRMTLGGKEMVHNTLETLQGLRNELE